MVGRGNTWHPSQNLNLCSFRKVNFKSPQSSVKVSLGGDINYLGYQLSRSCKTSLKIFTNLSHGFWCCCMLSYENSFFSLFSVSILGSSQYWELEISRLVYKTIILNFKKKKASKAINLEFVVKCYSSRMQINPFKKKNILHSFVQWLLTFRTLGLCKTLRYLTHPMKIPLWSVAFLVPTAYFLVSGRS